MKRKDPNRKFSSMKYVGRRNSETFAIVQFEIENEKVEGRIIESKAKRWIEAPNPESRTKPSLSSDESASAEPSSRSRLELQSQSEHELLEPWFAQWPLSAAAQGHDARSLLAQRCVQIDGSSLGNTDTRSDIVDGFRRWICFGEFSRNLKNLVCRERRALWQSSFNPED
ncbi:hypothetical protein HZH68_004850 [Vespula germanica]|uniref:Uncharacterized protein n=1 Tax=Vespula germanica TaxID=30212 RepID=A0A834KM47_VESGE|nr:hypothetical protein HZH68_004850 [Vespula germanica]